jgi:actin, other eukaryote
MEKIWLHTFYNEFRSVPEAQNLFMSEDIGNTNPKRRKTCQMVFETFDVPGFHLEQSSVLSLYASGRTTGTVLKSGHTKNNVCCIENGYILPKVEISYFGGRDISKKLEEMIKHRYTDISWNSFESNGLKENSEFSFVSMNPYFESVKKEYEICDGTKIELQDELYLAPEMLFNSSLSSGEVSVHRLIQYCITNQDEETKDVLWKNILVSGGGSKFKGFSERLSKELTYLTSNEFNVISPTNRRFSNWIGASIIGKLDSFESMIMTKEQYNEHGDSLVDSVCFNNVELIHRAKLPNTIQENLKNYTISTKFTEINFYFF